MERARQLVGRDIFVRLLAKALGRSQDTIVIRSYLLGGGFGRRLDGDYIVPADWHPRRLASLSRWSARELTTCALTARAHLPCR
jgi:hypothetical protein